MTETSPPRRHLVDDRDIQVAVQGHGQGARDRCRRHHQDVRRPAAGALRPQAGALVHAETVLLVDDGQAERLEDDRVFQQGMGTDQDPDRTVAQPLVDRTAGGRGDGTGQQFAADSGRRQVPGNICIVLTGKDFRRCHQTGLVAVAHGDEGRQNGDHRLAGPDVALQEPVHLVPAHEVRADFLDHPLLRPGQRIG